ncbi:hypothetical protein [Pseudodesulfovibrio sp.]|uniref:hypothetical protein n=1 Tax=Pseudodesulfovibrio sp. TaxID=2035812 RepID=UPI00260B9EF8|nr:hypothetical protein [Pseudodesulfovibrio sp.]MDD3311688.1 hypothetical protein [Pseudodesulfovibrio sp.]
MPNTAIVGSLLSELPEKLNYIGSEMDFLSEKRARLFPAGTSKTTKETNVTSIFLSALAAIKPYREAMLAVLHPKAKKVSNKSAQLHVFTEIEDRDACGCKTEKGRPDGLIVLTTGKAQTIEWAAFVEAKVNSDLNAEQIQRYIEMARAHEVDLITISDQIVATPFQTPIVDKLNHRNVNLYHWSWIYIRTKAQQVVEAARQKGNNEAFDPDQIYITEEFIRYLDDPKIEVGHFQNMGREWAPAVKELRQTPIGAKVKSDIVNAVATAWLHEEQDLCYYIYLKTRLKVYLGLTKKEKVDVNDRKERIVNALQDRKRIEFDLWAPQSASLEDSLESSPRKKLQISVCFLSSSIHLSTEVEVGMNQKAVGQTSAFIARMEAAGAGMEDELKISAGYRWRKKTSPVPFKELQQQKARKLDYSTVNKDFGDQIERMEISQCIELGRSAFASPTNFITRLETVVTNFVNQVYNV